MLIFGVRAGVCGRGMASELRVAGSRAIVATMRVPGSWLLLAASFSSSLALAQPVAPESARTAPAAPAAAAAPESAPAAPPPPPPEPAPTELPAAAPAAVPPATSEPAPASPAAVGSATATATATAPGASEVAPDETAKARPPAGDSQKNFERDFSALPLTLEARLGFNARLGSSFDDAAEEEHWGASYAFASYIAWSPRYALGLEVDHVGLGSVRALSAQNSSDNQYTATGAWIGARVFPIRGERLDFFVNLRLGMVFQHVDALGTRSVSDSITVPAQSYSCTAWDGPGLGLGGALGLAYRLGRHFSFVSRLDLTAQRLSGEPLGTCADGIGSVASLSGSVGLAYEFETAPK